MVPSVMPRRARSVAPMRMWVVVAGCVARDLLSPRLLLTATRPSAFIRRKAAGLPPASSKVTTVPPPVICRIARACCGWSARVGYSTRDTSGRPARKPATASAEAHMALTRSGSVSSPFSSSQALKADRLGPVLRMKGCSVSSTQALRASTAPPRTRPWPSMCLVQE